MPGFEIGKYTAHVFAIGVLTAGLMFAFDQIAPSFNNLAEAGHATPLAVEVQNVIYWSIIAYAPIVFVFASIGAIRVAQARSEYNSPYITTHWSGTFTLAVTIIVMLLINFLVTSILDPWVIGVGSWSTEGILGNIPSMMATGFNMAHGLAIVGIALAYLYMILISLKVTSLEWAMQ